MPYDAEFTRDERQLNQHENPYDAMSDDNSHSSDTVNSKKGFSPSYSANFSTVNPKTVMNYWR